MKPNKSIRQFHSFNQEAHLIEWSRVLETRFPDFIDDLGSHFLTVAGGVPNYRQYSSTFYAVLRSARLGLLMGRGEE